jgi:hypothetical protein
LTTRSTSPTFRVEHRLPGRAGCVLSVASRLREASTSFEDQWMRLANLGARGSLVLVCELAGQELAVFARAIGPWRGP